MRLLGVESAHARVFYETEALRGGWTSRQLDRQIQSQFYERTALSRNKAAILRKDLEKSDGVDRAAKWSFCFKRRAPPCALPVVCRANVSGGSDRRRASGSGCRPVIAAHPEAPFGEHRGERRVHRDRLGRLERFDGGDKREVDQGAKVPFGSLAEA